MQRIRESWLRVRTSTLLLAKWLVLAAVVAVNAYFPSIY